MTGTGGAKTSPTNVRRPRRPSWAYVPIDMDSGMRRQSLMDGSDYIEPTEDIGILVYIRIAGIDVEQLALHPFNVEVLRTDFVCILAESVETIPTVVRDFNGNAATLSEVPCHPSQGLVFGAFLSTDELHEHHGADVTTIKDILAVIRSDAVFKKLNAAAAMPQHSTRPDGSIHFELFATEGSPDPPAKPGFQCPWDLWTIAWDLWSIVPPADAVSQLSSLRDSPRHEVPLEGVASKFKERAFHEAASDDTSCTDHPDTLLSHRSSRSEDLSGSSYWCLPTVVNVNCESRDALARLMETISQEASMRSRSRQQLPRMSAERPSRWWLEMQEVPECSNTIDAVGGPCCVSHMDERAPCEVQIQVAPYADSVIVDQMAVLPIASHRGMATPLLLTSSQKPQPGVPTESVVDGPSTPRTPRLLLHTPRPLWSTSLRALQPVVTPRLTESTCMGNYAVRWD